MGIALMSLRQAEKVEPQLKAALRGGQAAGGMTARERMALREGSIEEAAAILNARQFVQRLIEKDRETTQAQMVWALGRIEPTELDAMVRQLARMRGRYASLVLEYGQSERPIGKLALEELQGLRERIAEFEHGFEMIKTAILDGTAEVTGVKTARL
ncbi:hypothetical protein [Ferrovibrio sp.]|uniref:hypothetical protein n=1 Tax=Ferrovibrio sp. TaxID=1917215 RepID=UPI0035164DC3